MEKVCPECGYKPRPWAAAEQDQCPKCKIAYNDPNSPEQSSLEKDKMIEKLPFVTSSEIVGTRIVRTLGMARGSTVRAKHIGRDIMAEIKNLVGGELKGYTELLAEGREEAIYRMKIDAAKLGGNAIVDVRLATSTLAAGASEVLAYGTAVKAVKEKSDG